MKTTRENKVDFDSVLNLGASLPGVKASSSPKGIALRLKRDIVACTAIHSSAEPNSLMVCIDFPARDALLAKQPDTYYLTDHYRSYATVLVRLPKIGQNELRSLLGQAVQFVGSPKPKKTSKSKKTSTRAKPRKTRRS